MTKQLAPVWILVVASCSQPAPAPAPVQPIENRGEPAPPDPTAHDVSGQWEGGAGCKPMGDELTLTGALIVRPFGKGTDGAVLDTGAGEWMLTYRAEGPLLALAGKRVVVRGRACEKWGEARFGKHFDPATIAESP